ncbi:hypothetical protein [Paenibacillus jilunlii]|uniref:Uncharacterized protein n=1 Tax=Paenibacillus jilunlii TaxID=682956 RepID=A0A1G9HQP6_9BACL|nr:hypothetical protein [Paenibacillus jilunlii]KWX69767.1 hypothetical protein AML91_28705 [Paenibacillus jilunlii]SDL15249.1 hypothetical protein SAMN05216191_101969 [Paenibacillus jilunlii]
MNWSDFGERNKRLNPLWTLGAGMNLGELQPYKEMIALSVLLQVYYLELESNEQRAREDIVELAWSSLERFNITKLGTAESVERLVDGLLWSGSGGDFEAYYYDDLSRQMAVQKYKYFTVDEDATRTSWEESGRTVYRLSEYAMELIFMSHEIIEEFQISIKLLEIQMHIKHGRVTRAMQDVGELISRVRKMTQQQQEYRNALRRNPKHMFSEYGVLRHRRLEEIHLQFDEERRHFDNIHRSLARLANDEKDVIDFNELRQLAERVELSRRVHDELAEVVLSIFEAETNLRLNFPELFWGAGGFNFRTHIWEEWVKSEGLPDADSLELLIGGLFTPGQDFIYPLAWAWEEQEAGFLPEDVLDEPDEGGEEESSAYTPKSIPWPQVSELWLPVFKGLAEIGSFTFAAEAFTEEEQRKWSGTPDAVDLWAQFFHTEITVQAQDADSQGGAADECQKLIQQLLAANPVLEVLRGKVLRTTIQGSHRSSVTWPGLEMSPYTITIIER